MLASDRGTRVAGSLATGSLVAMGEVHTGLLHHSTAVSPAQATRLLQLVPGERVRRSERPIAHALSPELLTGVDCLLPTASGMKVRAVGTAVSRAGITGGHVVQGSAYTRVTRGEAVRRLPWSHYLALPGVVETIGKADGTHLADGFLNGRPPAGHLDLGAIGQRVLDSVQHNKDHLDHRTAFRTSRTRLRWVLLPAGRQPSITFAIDDETTRTVRLTAHDAVDVAAHVELCEDLALHDWLLTTLLALIERSRIGSGSRLAVVQRLRPAIDFLLHLWMPAARIHPTLAELWHSLDTRPGLSRQWQVNVDRVRDQLALGAIERLSGG